jgi:DNA-binding helix-hairpin-helix protein with protein kinase domain
MRLFGASSPDVYVRGKRIKVDPTLSIGKGGEADVFSLGPDLVLKLFKTPDHPDLAADPDAREGARARLEMHQTKLPLFPSPLPERVVSPVDLATDKPGRRVLGYTMPLVAGAEVLMRYSDPGFRASSVPLAALGPLLADLHRTVESLHARGVVIGDFNDLNILVRGSEAHLIDADSFQFGAFPCAVYTERFLDPLLCDPAAPRPAPARPYAPASDWYAFAALALQTLLCVGPYGGVYKPRPPPAASPTTPAPSTGSPSSTPRSSIPGPPSRGAPCPTSSSTPSRAPSRRTTVAPCRGACSSRSPGAGARAAAWSTRAPPAPAASRPLAPAPPSRPRPSSAASRAT